MFEGMTKKSSFSCFMPFFMSYCPHFWCYRRICMARKTRYMFETYEQKLIVFASYFRFHELCSQIWQTRAIYNDLKTRYMFEGMTKNSSFSCFITVFMSYTPQFLRSREIFMFESYDQNLVIFMFMAIFISYCPIVLGI